MPLKITELVMNVEKSVLEVTSRGDPLRQHFMSLSNNTLRSKIDRVVKKLLNFFYKNYPKPPRDRPRFFLQNSSDGESLYLSFVENS